MLAQIWQKKNRAHEPWCGLVSVPDRHPRRRILLDRNRNRHPCGTALAATPCAPSSGGLSARLWSWAPTLGPGGRDVRERRLAKFRQNVARFRLYRLRFFARKYAFCSIFRNLPDYLAEILNIGKILQILQHFQKCFSKCCWNFTKIADFSNRFFC